MQLRQSFLLQAQTLQRLHVRRRVRPEVLEITGSDVGGTSRFQLIVRKMGMALEKAT